TFLLIIVPPRLLIFYRAGLYRRLWRYAGLVELERIVVACVISGALGVALGVWLLPAVRGLPVRGPVSVAVVDAGLVTVVVSAPGLLVRWVSQNTLRARPAGERRVLIAGAGSAGELIAKELRTNVDLGLTPVGFVDDDVRKHGLEMCGLRVLGPIARLVDFRERLRIDEVIIAMPSAAGSVIREALRKADLAGLKART